MPIGRLLLPWLMACGLARGADPQLDRYGDPLPPGAVARLGKTWPGRWRDQIAPGPDGKTIRCLRYGIHVLDFDRDTGKLRRSSTLPTEPVYFATMSADGRRAVLFGEADTSVPTDWQVWDLDCKVRISTIRREQTGRSGIQSISPDGRFVADLDDGYTRGGLVQLRVQVWNADTGRLHGTAEVELGADDRGGGWTSGPVFSADGRHLLLSCGRRNQSFFYGLETARVRVLWQKAFGTSAGVVSFDLGDRLLLSDESGSRTAAWKDGTETAPRLPPGCGANDSVAVVNGGTTLLYQARVGKERELRAWDLKRGATDLSIRPFRLKPTTYPSRWPEASPHVLLFESVPRLLDLRTHHPVGPEAAIAAHGSGVGTLVFSADGTRLAAADDDYRIRVWDTTTGRSLGGWAAVAPSVHSEYNLGGGFTSYCGAPAFDLTADGRNLVFADPPGTEKPPRLRIVDLVTGRTRATRALPRSKPGDPPVTASRVTFASEPDTVFVAFGPQYVPMPGDLRHTLARWDLAADRWTELGAIPTCPPARSARANDRWVARGKVFDIHSGRPVVELAGAARWEFTATADGRLAAGLGRADRPASPIGILLDLDPIADIRLWDARTGAAVAHLICPPLAPRLPLPDLGPGVVDSRPEAYAAAAWPRVLALHPSGRWLATADVRGVRLWDLLHGRVVHTFPLPHRPPMELGLGTPATALAFTPDGRRLATGLPDGSILIWSVPIPEPDPLRTAELDPLWADLIGPDAGTGWRAVWRLLDDPTAAVRLVASRLKPAEAVPAADVARLLADVDSPDYRRREAATRRLTELSDRVRDTVAAAERAPGASAELRERLRTVLAAAPSDDRPLPSGAAGPSRAVAVLEHAGTAEGRAALRALADGCPGAWLTHEARAALGRLRPSR